MACLWRGHRVHRVFDLRAARRESDREFARSTGSESCDWLYSIVFTRRNSLRNNFDPAVVPAKPSLLYFFAGRPGNEPAWFWSDLGQYHFRPDPCKPQDRWARLDWRRVRSFGIVNVHVW